MTPKLDGLVPHWQATPFVPDAGTLTEGPRWDGQDCRLQ